MRLASRPVFGFLVLGALALGTEAEARSRDFYTSLSELRSREREGIDFRIESRLRPQSPGSRILILAPHGGKIEEGTSELARLCAGNDWSVYVFEGLKPTDNQRLHITSTRFDEPKALEAVRGHDGCVSLHGFQESRKDRICVGGRSAEARKAMGQSLREAAPDVEVEEPCRRLPGSEPDNIGNRCLQGGVQLELSTHLRQALLKDSVRAKRIAEAIRAGMRRALETWVRRRPSDSPGARAESHGTNR